MNYQQQLANSAAIRAEIQRFESVHPNIYSIYELLERVEEPVLQNQIREHVIAIEGETVAPARRGEGASGGRWPRTSPSPWPCAPQKAPVAHGPAPRNLSQPTALLPLTRRPPVMFSVSSLPQLMALFIPP